jgi:hypothetical protein
VRAWWGVLEGGGGRDFKVVRKWRVRETLVLMIYWIMCFLRDCRWAFFRNFEII